MLFSIRLVAVCALVAVGFDACKEPEVQSIAAPAAPSQYRLKSVQSTIPSSATQSASGYTYTYSYDSLNRPITVNRVVNGVAGSAQFAYGDPQRKYVLQNDVTDYKNSPTYTVYIERPNPADQSTWTIATFPLVLDGTDFVVNQYRTYPGPVINSLSPVRDYYYKFDATKHIKSMQTAGPSTPGDFNYYTYTLTGDNITSQEFIAAGGHGGKYTTTFTYDAQLNPFFGMQDPTASVLQRYSRNNVTSSTVFIAGSSSSSTETYTYAYEYNAQNLPTKQTATFNGVAKETQVYTYESY